MRRANERNWVAARRNPSMKGLRSTARMLPSGGLYTGREWLQESISLSLRLDGPIRRGLMVGGSKAARSGSDSETCCLGPAELQLLDSNIHHKKGKPTVKSGTAQLKNDRRHASQSSLRCFSAEAGMSLSCTWIVSSTSICPRFQSRGSESRRGRTEFKGAVG